MFADEPRTARRWLLACTWACAAAVVVSGLSGCWKRSGSTAAQKNLAKLKEKKPQPPFELPRVFTEPNELSSFVPDEKDTRRIALSGKPGHWMSVLLQTRSNLIDFNGQLASTPQNSRQQPLDLLTSPFWVSTSRVVTLPKEQRKTLETLFYPPQPDPDSTTKGATWIGNKLTGSKGPTLSSAEMVSHMPSFQYYLVVLARQADRYRYLNDLASVRPPVEFAPPNVLDTCYYRVQFPAVDEPLALARNPLCWTSTAHVWWDDVLPGALVPEQQQAMLDWLHWGGSLVISGPDSLDKLRGSFLEPYLPAIGGTAGPLAAEKLAELHRHWTVEGDKSRPPGTRAGAPWSGIAVGEARGRPIRAGHRRAGGRAPRGTRPDRRDGLPTQRAGPDRLAELRQLRQRVFAPAPAAAVRVAAGAV